jgi:hypothetical protein
VHHRSEEVIVVVAVAVVAYQSPTVTRLLREIIGLMIMIMMMTVVMIMMMTLAMTPALIPMTTADSEPCEGTATEGTKGTPHSAKCIFDILPMIRQAMKYHRATSRRSIAARRDSGFANSSLDIGSSYILDRS